MRKMVFDNICEVKLDNSIREFEKVLMYVNLDNIKSINRDDTDFINHVFKHEMNIGIIRKCGFIRVFDKKIFAVDTPSVRDEKATIIMLTKEDMEKKYIELPSKYKQAIAFDRYDEYLKTVLLNDI